MLRRGALLEALSQDSDCCVGDIMERDASSVEESDGLRSALQKVTPVERGRLALVYGQLLRVDRVHRGVANAFGEERFGYGPANLLRITCDGILPRWLLQHRARRSPVATHAPLYDSLTVLHVLRSDSLGWYLGGFLRHLDCDATEIWVAASRYHCRRSHSASFLGILRDYGWRSRSRMRPIVLWCEGMTTRTKLIRERRQQLE